MKYMVIYGGQEDHAPLNLYSDDGRYVFFDSYEAAMDNLKEDALIGSPMWSLFELKEVVGGTGKQGLNKL